MAYHAQERKRVKEPNVQERRHKRRRACGAAARKDDWGDEIWDALMECTEQFSALLADPPAHMISRQQQQID